MHCDVEDKSSHRIFRSQDEQRRILQRRGAKCTTLATIVALVGGSWSTPENSPHWRRSIVVCMEAST